MPSEIDPVAFKMLYAQFQIEEHQAINKALMLLPETASPKTVERSRNQAVIEMWRGYIISLNKPIDLLVDGRLTSFATEVVRIGSASNCHIVASGPDVAHIHIVIIRRRDGYIWLTNLHTGDVGVTIQEPNQSCASLVTGNTILEPGTAIHIGNRVITVVDY